MDSRAALNEELLGQILERAPQLTVGVLGDLFLDRYLDIDGSLNEPSLETGLDAYQVMGVRAIPGAAGTVVNNLAALGVGRIVPIAILGDDGEGHELRQALRKMPAVVADALVTGPERRTPTYTKPLLHLVGQPPRELNRLDIKNRQPLPDEWERQVIELLENWVPEFNALLVLDQVSEVDCGVITARVRDCLARLGAADAGPFVLVDSRERIGSFQNVAVKPNRAECVRAVFGPDADLGRWREAARHLANRLGRPVFCTAGEEGILVADSRGEILVPAYPVSGPIDIVGAGDSTSAAIVLAVACGAGRPPAAAFGNLVASITITQIGTTGTASPDQVRCRWAEVLSGAYRPHAAEQA
jgi:bifunctional ADP-heptose synthase (sugar kinase/adenylyltransferase)